MANKMLIDATHPEETRVVVVRGNRVEEFDFESANRRPLRGNIYLAKVTRVEPSLQAAFVDYGGNRHGFLAFGEIHPDYYQIPVADRQRLIEEDQRAAEESDQRRKHRSQAKSAANSENLSEDAEFSDQPGHHDDHPENVLTNDPQETGDQHESEAPEHREEEPEHREEEPEHREEELEHREETPIATAAYPEPEAQSDEGGEPASDEILASSESDDEAGERSVSHVEESPADDAAAPEVVESVVSGDALEELPERAPRRHRTYKIQEVIKRRQIILVQVVKEERGTKGAALTTYLSLAGRYSVLMPNTARGGGISRKITDGADRRRLKDLVSDLEVPEGMGVILRTAGAARTKTEIKRDFEYLLRQWEQVREQTLNSTAPALVYEEGSLVKRAIRDLYNKDIDEVIVSGDGAFKDSKEFMRMLMPSHAKNVKPYRDTLPVFSRFGVEHQLDAMFSPVVQLKSGGYIVINPTEALVSIDVNSGRATREHNIEDTALKTNLEASEEIARQLRLRDLAGLIVIDFIDMEENRNNRAVERKMKDCLKHDRARIQVGRISHFGLMEMSRQRIRQGVLESSTEICPTCGGTGHMRSVSSVALHLLRALEEQLMKSAANDLIVRTRPDTALYLLNHKRAHLRDLEGRFGVMIIVQSETTLSGQQYFVVEKGGAASGVANPTLARPGSEMVFDEQDEADALIEDEVEEEEEFTEVSAAESAEDDEQPSESGDQHGRRRRRRGRRGGRGRDRNEKPNRDTAPRVEAAEGQEPGEEFAGDAQPATEGSDAHEEQHARGEGQPQRSEGDADGDRKRRRRGRRGGRRNRRDRFPNGDQPQSEQNETNGNYVSSGDTDEIDTTAQPEPRLSEPEAHPPLPENPVTAPQQFDTAQPVSTPVEEPTKRRSTVREAPPVMRFEESQPSASVHERTESPPLASGNGDQDNAPAPSSTSTKKGWWRR
ncbi:MAG: Rne/Rng family ribonuclease [Rhizobiales bacterium]|nr:Rne/Rng family ribonuclease [Hyphomicrobiales bacterium]